MAQKSRQSGSSTPRPNAAERISSLEKNPENGGTPAIAAVASSMSR